MEELLNNFANTLEMEGNREKSMTFSICVEKLVNGLNEAQKLILYNLIEEIIETFKQKNHELCECRIRALDTLNCFLKVTKAIYDSKILDLDQVNFRAIQKLLNEFDSDGLVFMKFLMLRQLFELFVEAHWIRSARALFECINSCYHSVKNGEKTVYGNEDLTASFLVVQEFELRYDQVCYLNQMMNEFSKPEFLAVDQKTAKIWKQLKEYKEMKELPSEVKDFSEAEEISRAMLKIHDAQEIAYPNYKTHLEKIKFLYHGLKNADNFEPNSKLLARAGAYEVISFHTTDPKLKCKLLKKSNDYRREHCACIPAGDFTKS
jgi:hypothetical protein